MSEIITIKQLPIIEQQLKAVKEQAEKKVNEALSLACTEETRQSIKDVRADLNKEFKELENSRKSVKKEILKPYNEFESIYKDCITDIYQPADKQLKQKIDEVENTLKDDKKQKVLEFFNEYNNIDFIKFDDIGINITLSASLKSLKDEVKKYIDKINDDLKLIDTQEYKAEILVEYKKCMNVSQAITTVVERHTAIEKEKQSNADKDDVIEDDDDFFNLDTGSLFTGNVIKNEHTIHFTCTNFIYRKLIEYMGSHNIKFTED